MISPIANIYKGGTKKQTEQNCYPLKGKSNTSFKVILEKASEKLAAKSTIR